MEIELEIRRNGEVSKVTLDLDVSRLSDLEMERIESVTTDEERTVAGRKLFRAIVWAKLIHTPYSDIGEREFDFYFDELAAHASTETEEAWTEDAVVIPMETNTGTVEAQVEWNA